MIVFFKYARAITEGIDIEFQISAARDCEVFEIEEPPFAADVDKPRAEISDVGVVPLARFVFFIVLYNAFGYKFAVQRRRIFIGIIRAPMQIEGIACVIARAERIFTVFLVYGEAGRRYLFAVAVRIRYRSSRAVGRTVFGREREGDIPCKFVVLVAVEDYLAVDFDGAVRAVLRTARGAEGEAYESRNRQQKSQNISRNLCHFFISFGFASVFAGRRGNSLRRFSREISLAFSFVYYK